MTNIIGHVLLASEGEIPTLLGEVEFKQNNDRLARAEGYIFKFLAKGLMLYDEVGELNKSKQNDRII